MGIRAPNPLEQSIILYDNVIKVDMSGKSHLAKLSDADAEAFKEDIAIRTGTAAGNYFREFAKTNTPTLLVAATGFASGAVASAAMTAVGLGLLANPVGATVGVGAGLFLTPFFAKKIVDPTATKAAAAGEIAGEFAAATALNSVPRNAVELLHNFSETNLQLEQKAKAQEFMKAQLVMKELKAHLAQRQTQTLLQM